MENVADRQSDEIIRIWESIRCSGPKDNLLRKIKENIDFSFVNPILKKQYCEAFGRLAKEPEMMFKIMFLKRMYDMSDARCSVIPGCIPNSV